MSTEYNYNHISHDIMTDEIKEKLKFYQYVNDITKLKKGDHIKYLKKGSNSRLYGGIFRRKVNSSIIELYTGPKKWLIYIDECYLFYKEIEKNIFRKVLEQMVNNKFKVIKKE